MCTTLPRVLVTVMGIEKVVPEWRDIEVFAQLLPRSSTAERMNPYTSFWTGVRPGDGPEEFHLVLLDNGRTDVLADEVGRQALHCIRCSACLNVCPVYSRTGGQAYGSIYPGPIGAILTPQLRGLDQAPTLPWASSLCGACYEACPVQIDIPSVLVHLRGRVVREVEGKGRAEKAVMGRSRACSARAGATRRRRSSRGSAAGRSPASASGTPGLGAWAQARDLPEIPAQSFRDWWRSRDDAPGSGGMSAGARDVVLRRIRDALGPAPAAPEIEPRLPPRGRVRSPSTPVERFCEVVADYDATVHRVARRGLEDGARARCAASAAPRGSWRRPGCRGASTAWSSSPTTRRSAPRDLDAIDGVLTGCAAAIAQTGTIVLDGAGVSGRRAITLVPDLHLCVVRADQVVPAVPDAVAAVAPAVARGAADHLRLRARRRRPTSSSTACRACTARARSTSSSWRAEPHGLRDLDLRHRRDAAARRVRAARRGARVRRAVRRRAPAHAARLGPRRRPQVLPLARPVRDPHRGGRDDDDAAARLRDHAAARSATRSRRRRRSRASITSPAVGSRSGSARAGTCPRSRTTARRSGSASASCASAPRR